MKYKSTEQLKREMEEKEELRRRGR